MASVKISAAVFVVALAARVINGPPVQLTPLDDLYHWKRIAHFPPLLEFDPDRGERGAYCPWPPLYDAVCGAIAKLLGMRAILWIPPLVGALACALATRRAGLAAGMALATSPFLVTESSVGDIDHHFLEWPLAFAILFAVAPHPVPLPARGERVPKAGEGRWIALAIAMTAAMFIQTAMLPACALAFVVLFILDERRAAYAFGTVAIIISLYRLTRPTTYPDSPWFLGWPHAALFAAAAVALVLRKRPVLAILAGTAVAAAFLPTIVRGSHFFGGDPWLKTISEFQPVWKGNLDDWISFAAGFSIGAILVFDLIRRRAAGAIALFALAYFVLAMTSRRFVATAIPLLALAAAVDAAMILRRKAAVFAGAAIALIPAVQLALWMIHPTPPVSPEQQQWIRTAEFLRTQPPGRVLAPWSMGHCLDVLGQHAVVIDNFGSMPDRDVFERANAALQSDDPSSYCQRIGVRYLVRQKPPGPRFRLVYPNVWEFFGGGPPPSAAAAEGRGAPRNREYFGGR